MNVKRCITLPLRMCSLFNNFAHAHMLLSAWMKGESQESQLCFFFHRISTNLKLIRRRCTSAISTSCVTCTYRLRTTQVRGTFHSLLGVLMTFCNSPDVRQYLLHSLGKNLHESVMAVGRAKSCGPAHSLKFNTVCLYPTTWLLHYTSNFTLKCSLKKMD